MTIPAAAPRPATTHAVMNRFEVKYLVATAAVPAMLDEFGVWTRPDPHDPDGRGYRVRSVYWDTADLRFFWEKIEGLKYRRKLRFRRYGDAPLVFAEVKQREDRTLHKRRLAWTADRIRAVFGDGTRPVDWEGVHGDPVATEIALMIDRLGLRPVMAVAYRRRARYGAFDPELRLTFDGRVQFDPSVLDVAGGFDIGRYALDPRATVLEIKYNHRAPRWLTKAICRYGLKMVRMSKYCNAVDRCWYGGQLT